MLSEQDSAWLDGEAARVVSLAGDWLGTPFEAKAAGALAGAVRQYAESHIGGATTQPLAVLRDNLTRAMPEPVEPGVTLVSNLAGALAQTLTRRVKRVEPHAQPVSDQSAQPAATPETPARASA